MGVGEGGGVGEGVEVLLIASKTLHLSSLQTPCFCLYVTQLLKLFLNVPVSSNDEGRRLRESKKTNKQKTMGSFNNNNNNTARAAHFLVYVFARLRHETSSFNVLWRT